MSTAPMERGSVAGYVVLTRDEILDVADVLLVSAGALENDLTVRLVEKSCSEGWARQGSNLRPEDYESPALTTELQAQGLIYKGFLR